MNREHPSSSHQELHQSPKKMEPEEGSSEVLRRSLYKKHMEDSGTSNAQRNTDEQLQEISETHGTETDKNTLDALRVLRKERGEQAITRTKEVVESRVQQFIQEIAPPESTWYSNESIVSVDQKKALHNALQKVAETEHRLSSGQISQRDVKHDEGRKEKEPEQSANERIHKLPEEYERALDELGQSIGSVKADLTKFIENAQLIKKMDQTIPQKGSSLPDQLDSPQYRSRLEGIAQRAQARQARREKNVNDANLGIEYLTSFLERKRADFAAHGE